MTGNPDPGDLVATASPVTPNEPAPASFHQDAAQGYELLVNLAELVPGVIYQYRLYPDGRSAFPYSSTAMNTIYEVTPEEVREDATPVFGRIHLREIHKAARRSADLTRQLLAFARKQTIAPRVLDVNDTVESMLTMLRRLIGEGIELRWRPGRHGGRVAIDPTQVDQLLANLCLNARDAIDGVGTVTIETDTAAIDETYCAIHPDATPGAYVRLSVTDDGCGMDDAVLSHLFEPFFTTKAIGRGTGLGLATVFGIIQQNLGFVEVRSSPGRGTTFSVFLPSHEQEADRSRARPAERSRRGHETVLLVEDESALLGMTSRILSAHGYLVLAAGSPNEALRRAEEHPGEIDLLMTDVIMPGMNGRELAAELRARYPQLKLLFTSGYTDDVIAPHGVLETGMAFLQKPFSVTALTEKVREVLDQG